MFCFYRVCDFDMQSIGMYDMHVFVCVCECVCKCVHGKSASGIHNTCMYKCTYHSHWYHSYILHIRIRDIVHHIYCIEWTGISMCCTLQCMTVVDCEDWGICVFEYQRKNNNSIGLKLCVVRLLCVTHWNDDNDSDDVVRERDYNSLLSV